MFRSYFQASQVAQWVKNLPVMQETQEMCVQSLRLEDPLEKGMATHSSILAWRIPWTEEAGGLQSMRSQRVRHNCSDWAWPYFLGDGKVLLNFTAQFSQLGRIKDCSLWSFLCLEQFLQEAAFFLVQGLGQAGCDVIRQLMAPWTPHRCWCLSPVLWSQGHTNNVTWTCKLHKMLNAFDIRNLYLDFFFSW